MITTGFIAGIIGTLILDYIFRWSENGRRKRR